MIFWIIVLVIVAIALGLAWKKDRDRRAVHSTHDSFGNHAEQRLLEEDHGVTVHGGPGESVAPASTRQGEGSSISYYGGGPASHTNGGGGVF